MASKRNFFSEMEKKTIIREFVDKHKDVLESKQSDFRSIKKKADIWKLLTEEFNAQPGVNKRDEMQVKKCCENMKIRAKTALSKERRERLLTGGGSQPSPTYETSQAIAGIVSSQINPLPNPFDDDASQQDLHGNDDSEGIKCVAQQRYTNQKSEKRARSAESSESFHAPKVTKRYNNSIALAQQEVLDQQNEELILQMKILETKLSNMNEEHKMKMKIYRKKLQILDLQKRHLEEYNVNNVSRNASRFGIDDLLNA